MAPSSSTATRGHEHGALPEKDGGEKGAPLPASCDEEKQAPLLPEREGGEHDEESEGDEKVKESEGNSQKKIPTKGPSMQRLLGRKANGRRLRPNRCPALRLRARSPNSAGPQTFLGRLMVDVTLTLTSATLEQAQLVPRPLDGRHRLCEPMAQPSPELPGRQ